MDLLEAIKRNCLPDYLNITQWIMLMYPDPNNQADFEDVIKKKNLKLDRKIATEKLIQACKNGLPYIGDIEGKVYNWLVNSDPYPVCNNGIHARLEGMRITPELGHWRDNFVKWDVNRCVIHKSVMKPYLISEGKWPLQVEGLRLSYFDDDELETEVIKDSGMGNQITTLRKKYIPKQKEASEGLTLIDQLCRKYKVNYLDQLSGLEAWGKIVSKEFVSALIKNIDDTNTIIIYTTGVKQTKTDFLEQYRKRFEAE